VAGAAAEAAVAAVSVVLAVVVLVAAVPVAIGRKKFSITYKRSQLSELASLFLYDPVYAAMNLLN
jgi:hypothetical protein